MNETLSIRLDKKNVQQGLIVSLFMSVAVLLLWYLSAFLSIDYSLKIVIRFVLGCMSGLFLIGALYGLAQLRNHHPVAILSDKGIWLKYYGFIPWEGIDTISVYNVPTTPLEALGIRLKNTTVVSRQASLSGKCGLFWANLFGYSYHITLASPAYFDTSYDVILVFARRFLDNPHN